MKQRLLAFACVMSTLLFSSAYAQTDITIGTGTGTNAGTTYPCPLQDYYEGSRAQYLYTAAELQAAGMSPGNITNIKFTVTSLGNFTGLIEGYAIRMATTTATSLSATSWETVPATNLYGPVDYVPTVGVNNFTLNTPFFWNGTSNIVVEVCNGGDEFTSNPLVTWTTGLSFNGSHTYRVDNLGSLCGTATTTNTGEQTTRPNIIFTYTPAAACTGTVTGGTVSASSTTVCLGSSFSLSVSGATLATGLTYQWQSAPSATGPWTNIPGATSFSLTTSQTTSTFYRRVTTCTGSGAVANSTAVQILSPSLVSGTFTINNNAPATVPNFQSFNAAYDYIKCGINGPVTFNVNNASGPYNEQLIMQPVPGASVANIVTFNGNGRTIKYSSANTNERAVIKLDGADHIRFDSLTIDATPVGAGTTYGYGFQLINNADSNVLRRSTILTAANTTSTNYAGVVINASATGLTTSGATLCDSNYIANNTITGGYLGISAIGSSSDAIQRNVILNNTISNFYIYGIYASFTFSTVVEGNDISRPTASPSTTFYGIYSSGISVNLNINRNRIHDPYNGTPTSTSSFYGIFFSGVDAISGFENRVTNNLIYNVTGNGIQYGIYNTSSDNVLYYHNTISLDNTTSTGSSSTYGFYQTTAAAGISFINNIVTIGRGGTGSKFAVYLATSTSTIALNRNDYFIRPTAGGTNNFIGYNGTNQATLAAWIAATSQDANSVTEDPLFTNAAAGNLRPTSALVNDLGTPVGVAFDVENAPRPTAAGTTPDIGAYEFSVPPCAGTLVGGTAITSATPVCIGTLFSLNVNSATLASGITYQWQYSDNAGTTWINLPNGTSASVSLSQPNTRLYRRVITCTASGSTATSSTVQVVSPTLVSGTFTINNNAPATVPNFQSYNAAYDYIKCGINGPVTFNVNGASGPYNEQLIMQPVPGASVANTVTFNGNGRTIKYSSTNSDERAVIKLDGADHIRFDSLTIDATPVGTGTTYGFGFQLINNADSNVLRRSTILAALNSTSTNYAGVVMSASASSATTTGATLCDSNYIANNTITGGYVGISAAGGASDAIQRNVILNNTIRDFYIYGIYTYYSFNQLVQGNDISRPTATTSTTFYGIYSYGISVNLNITKNRIHNPFDGTPASTSTFYGIYTGYSDAPSGFENRVTNNLIYNVNGTGINYGLYNASSDNVLYYHNTVSLENTGNTSTSATYGFYQTVSATGIEFLNNIITVSRGGNAAKYAVYLDDGVAGITLNRNVYLVNAATGQNYIGYNIANRATLAAWQASTSQEANSVVTNPLYTNPATGNFTPRSVVIDNIGTLVGVTTDIVNNPRPISPAASPNPDPGAYEFIVPPCTTPPTAGNAVAVPNSGICMGTEVLLSLNGATAGSGQTVQWQYAASTAGPWTNLGGPMLFADTTIYASTTLYYRAILTCSGNSATSTPVLVTLNPAFLSGFYTINPAAPVSTTNFQNFTTAVAALDCGITGFVTFDVSPGTYNERIRMRRIAGAGPNSRVTFRSLTGVPTSVTLTSGTATAAANYVLELDSASYITYKNMSITGTNTTNARVVELSNTASYDSIVNCNITVPVGTGTATTSAGIFANTLIGTNNVIKGNTITNGVNGIYLAGVSVSIPTTYNVIDSNTVNGAYYYGIYASFNNRVQVTRNTVNRTAPLNTTSYGIYGNYCDTSYQFVANTVNITNATGTVYGMYLNYCDATISTKGRIANNKIQGITGLTGTTYGLYVNYGSQNNTVNNVINVKTTAATSYGIYSNFDNNTNYWNNTVQNASTSTGATSVAAYFAHSSGANGNNNIRNNIFSHTGGGRALSYTNASAIYSDYNMLYTTGATLVSATTPNGTYATLQDWRNASTWDVNSIVYEPSFASAADLTPNLTSPTVWGMHGRGTQIQENDYDFNNNARPTTLQAGVPDLGAYEFLPTSTPVALIATPAAPAAGTTQTFMLGTDTVTKVTWPVGSPVPPSMTLRRYSGILPPGVPATQPRMYFYVDADTMTVNTYNATVRQFYLDPWQGFINSQTIIKMGKTLLNGSWFVNPQSVVNTVDKHITETGVTYLDKFTGLTDGNAAPNPPQIVQTGDSSNRGTQFWVGYGHNYYFNWGNEQDMILYLSAEQAANVTVRVNGTSYSRTYAVPANSAITTAPIPKLGISDARLLTEGLSNRGISISSDVPIVAYAHIYYQSSSGASLLLPVGTYGYEYTSLGTPQSYTSTDYSWVNVIAAYDSTVVQITPANPTLGGRPANVPFTITMNKGDVYQVLGAIISGSNGYDMTGTKVLSIANASGKCYPVAVFSGSSRTSFGCDGNLGGSGDNMIQQNFPSQAWGRRYVVAPTSNASAASTLMANIVRVAVKDPSTVVTRNGVPLTGLINNYYYQFRIDSATYIAADKPIAVAQLEPSTTTTNCANNGGNGDPEMFYVSPIEQGIKKVVLYRNTVYDIDQQYITLVIPTTGLTSLQIDGSNTFDYVYPVSALPGYSVVVKRYGTATAGQTTIVSDSAFTAITYGLGSVESYGYNAGTLVKNLNELPSINNTLNSVGTTSAFTCARSPFRITVRLPLRATQIVWNLSALNNITPNTNVTQTAPVPTDSALVNGTMYYTYTINQDYVINDSGTYNIPITYYNPSIEGCSNSRTFQLPIIVRAAPRADFTANPATVCAGTAIQFNGVGSTSSYTINRWQWSFPDTTGATVQNPVKVFSTPGVKNITLRVITVEGCIGDTVKTVTVNPLPTIALVRDSLSICPGTADTLKVANPVAGVTYNWYNVATGGTPIATGPNYPVTVTGIYYAQATQGTCTSNRVRAVVNVYPQLAVPVVVVDSAGTNFIRFRWNAVPGAVSYSVTRDGINFIVPSSGATGLTHTVQPLNPLDTASLVVRANGVNSCQNSLSLRLSARTLPDQIYIPNAFTPNGDGRNDVWQVYGYVIRNVNMAIFNQWGQKIFEGTNQQTGWDGTYKGKQQPVGVYMYVVQLTLNDGTTLTKKGSVNLVR